jgi:hypothetical protein
MTATSEESRKISEQTRQSNGIVTTTMKMASHRTNATVRLKDLTTMEGQIRDLEWAVVLLLSLRVLEFIWAIVRLL